MQIIDDEASEQTPVKKSASSAPKDDGLDLKGATVIERGQFAANMNLRNIVIPEGVTEIGEGAFYSCMALETVALPKTLKKIGKMAFMSCRALRHVEIPEGVEEICDLAFGATNNLKEVHLPDSLQRADRYIFGLGGDSPYATAYMSGELVCRLQENVKDSRYTSAVYARRYVIDGQSYENMYDYKPVVSHLGDSTSTEKKTSDRPLTAKEKETLQEAKKILDDMQTQMSSAASALEGHKQNLHKQEEEKQRRIEEAKKKGKSSRDEVKMLAVLLVEEAHGKLDRDDSEFAETYAEDFAAYDEKQLIALRRKVMPTIHETRAIEAAKFIMLGKPLEERFAISTANHFNISKEWDFEARGKAAVEVTRLWYREEEMPQLLQKMEEYKETTRQNIYSQLAAFRSEWSSYQGVKGDLHIYISENDDPVPEEHNFFHVKLDSNLDVRINLNNRSLGYLAISVMNIFAPCWKASPEQIWNAALQNEIIDSRGTTSATKRDAITARDKALSQLKINAASPQPAQPGYAAAPQRQSAEAKRSAQPANPNAKRIKELEESIAVLRREANSISGLFGFSKRNKIKKEIEVQQRELESLRREQY